MQTQPRLIDARHAQSILIPENTAFCDVVSVVRTTLFATGSEIESREAAGYASQPILLVALRDDSISQMTESRDRPCRASF